MSQVQKEYSRLADLYSLQILDTEDETIYDDIVEMASMICCTPVALLSFIDTDRQWVKARKGMSIRETARDVSFCSQVIQQDGPFVIPDAKEDDRFKENPFVTSGPRIRFYAGVPLKTTRGSAVGTLCVIGYTPKELTPWQEELLVSLGKHASALLDNRGMQIKQNEKVKTETRKLCHEINNPLSIILLSSTVIKRKLENNHELQSELKKLNQAIDGAARIGKLITNFHKKGRD